VTGMAAPGILGNPGGRLSPDGGASLLGRAHAFALALIVLLLLIPVFSLAPAAAQSPALIPLEATITQNAIMRQELAPPPVRQRTLRNRLGEPIAGVPPEKLKETRFKLAAVDFQAPAEVHLDPAIFLPAWRGSIGKQISLYDIGTVLEAIEDIYRQHDYVVIAKVPPQDFASGRIRIVGYAVYVTDAEVKGDNGRLRRRLDPIFARIKAMRPLRQSAIYRQLLIAEDLVDGEITAEWFQIGESAPGAARLEITIAANPASMLLNLDNYGSQTTGPLQASARGYVHDVLGQFESTNVIALTNPANPARLVLLSFQQNLPLGTNGLNLGYGIANSWSNPSGPEGDEALHSEVLIANLGLSYALLREMDRDVIISARLNENNSSVDVEGQPLSRDRTRWVSIGADYDDVIDGVGIVLSPAFLQGIDAFQANVPFSNFQAVTLNGAATTSLTEGLSAQLLFTGQYGFGSLPTAVLGFYGGEAIGRAFDPGALAGSSLASGAVQLTKQIDTGLPWLHSLTLFAYADYGAAWNHSGAPYAFASLSSAGAGLSADIADRLSVTALVAQPLTYDSRLAALGVDQSTRLRFTLSLRF
jgi:hemolysin activation/secretion protein